MWTIKYQRNNEDYQFNYTAPGEFNTDSPALEALLLSKLQNPPVLYGTPTGPSALFDPNVDYLTYYMIATILFTELGVESWNSEGDFLWPLENTPTKAVFSYLDFLKEKRHEFYNQCHTESGPTGGQFCGDNIDFVNLRDSEKKQIESAISAISKVHSLPQDYPTAKVEMTNSYAIGGADGTYIAEKNEILINRSIGIGGPEITFVHEFGHHITLGQEGNYSLDQFLDKVDRTPALSQWREEVNQSSTIQGIRDIAAEETARGYGGFFSYLADEREIFARSYAQYIAKKSRNKILLSQLKDMQDNNPNFTWPDSEFTNISSALDEYFKDRHLTASITAAGNTCHDPATGEFCTTAGAIQSVKATATIVKKINKELDSQGLSKDSPIRGVVNHRDYLLAIARDSEGKILGALAYTKTKYQLNTQDFRVLDEKKGTGTRIMQHLAQEALSTKDKVIGLYGALQTAVPFYQKMGAEFHRVKTGPTDDSTWRWSSTGSIEKDELKNLSNGTPSDKRLDVLDDSKFNLYGQPLGGYMAFKGEESYSDYKKKEHQGLRASGSGNPCHDPETGQFCETHGSDVRHFGFEDWPKDRSKIVLDTVKKLQKKYGISVTVNATDTPQNGAIQLEALASVDTPTLIDIHPGMKSQKWQDENTPKDILVSDKLEHVITHEYGHVLEIELQLSDPKAFKELRKPFIEAQNSLSDLEDGVGKGGAYKDLTTKVSAYAGDTVEEGIAEAFLQHEMGIQNKYSDHVGMHFNNLIKGGTKKN